MPDLRLEMALKGDVEQWAARCEQAALTGLKYATSVAAGEGQELLREDVRNAGLGDGIANAWRLELYPRGRQLSWSPSAFIFSKAAHIVEAHENGEPIRAAGGLMAVPIPGSPAYDIKVPRGGSRTAEITRRFGPLRLIVPRRGPPMLVAAGREGKGGGLKPLMQRRDRKSGERYTPLNQARADIPMFWLVPQVRLDPVLHWHSIFRRIEGFYGDRLDTWLRHYLAPFDGRGNPSETGPLAGRRL